MNLNQDDFYTGQELVNIYRNILEHGLPNGYTTGLNNLDKLFRLDKGRVAVVTGVPSYGKSTFVNFLCARYNIEHGLKTVIYTPETSGKSTACCPRVPNAADPPKKICICPV